MPPPVFPLKKKTPPRCGRSINMRAPRMQSGDVIGEVEEGSIDMRGVAQKYIDTLRYLRGVLPVRGIFRFGRFHLPTGVVSETARLGQSRSLAPRPPQNVKKSSGRCSERTDRCRGQLDGSQSGRSGFDGTGTIILASY